MLQRQNTPIDLDKASRCFHEIIKIVQANGGRVDIVRNSENLMIAFVPWVDSSTDITVAPRFGGVGYSIKVALKVATNYAIHKSSACEAIHRMSGCSVVCMCATCNYTPCECVIDIGSLFDHRQFMSPCQNFKEFMAFCADGHKCLTPVAGTTWWTRCDRRR